MHDEADKTNENDGGGDGVAGQVQHPPLVTEPLNPAHRVGDFQCKRSQRICGFIQTEHPGLVGWNYCRVFVLADYAGGDPTRILGFYTLSASAHARGQVGSQLQKKLPGGIPIPMALIGYMGRCDTAEKGVGALLIQDAARRAYLNPDLGIWGLMLDAENEALIEKVYKPAGFVRARKPKGAVETDPEPLVMYAPVIKFLPELNTA